MSDAPENFEKLSKALKIATYEVPPPGYFNNFSSKVIARIESERMTPSASASKGQLLNRFFSLLETNPLAAAGFGFSVCGLLIAGIGFSEYQDPSETVSTNILNNRETASVSKEMDQVPETMATLSQSSLTPSFKPALASNDLTSRLFDNFGSLSVKQVNFNTP